MNIPAKIDIMESVLLKGDLAKLTPEERLRYYNEVCRSLGLNPLTQPFSYVTLSGRQLLYATRNCADQLRKINDVSLEIVSEKVADNILTVHCRAKLPDGRVDEDFGAVYFPDNLTGDARANAKLKAVTKAKRRTTLSICGLGWLDETEVAAIPVVAHRRPPPPAPNAMVEHDPDTGELPPAPNNAAEEAAPSSNGVSTDGAVLSLEDMAREAAMHGEAVFKAFYKTRSKAEQKQLNEMGDELRGLMT